MRSGSFSTTGTALPLEITHGVDLYVWGKKVGYGYTTECGHGVRGSGWSLYLSRQAGVSSKIKRQYSLRALTHKGWLG